ncbi:MAG: mannose-1-phosphate guanylyltransferase/mannose-6-phosphate isomerase [Alphaproteobacteria bacterium]|jgi:mannose-1-phosphate guanylyltransferase/mannose-6-phosphate isomerase
MPQASLKKISNIVPFILCGGSGTRLFPVSRRDFPKQFVKLTGDLSLFQQTLLRLQKNFSHNPVIITGKNMKFIAQMQAKQIDCPIIIIVESAARNSGPAVLLSALYTQNIHSECGVAIFASDHIIKGDEAFNDALFRANQAIDNGLIATFGIMPTYPATAYGYIKPAHNFNDDPYQKVAEFIEKPSAEIAQTYIDNGYVWNSGNFAFPYQAILDGYQKHDLTTFNIVKQSLENANDDLGMISIDADYANAQDLSIDYAIMEKTDQLAVIASSFEWSDAGTWGSLYDLSDKDDNHNVLQGDILAQDTKNSFIRVDDNRLVTTIGLDNITIISTNDVLTVAASDQIDKVKEIVSTLKTQNRSEAVTQSKVYRPWGLYETIAMGTRYQVKRITVYPEGRLSLQKHFHRAEHWVIVSGSAEVTVNDTVQLLTENQSIYVPLGAVHRLVNPGKMNLELIEVQSGAYLGEDDIIRLQDDYKRP